MHQSTALPHIAVALGSIAQALLIEQSSVVAEGIPARRPSRRVQLVPFGEFAARDGRPFGLKVEVVGADGQSIERTVKVRNWVLSNEGGVALMMRLNERHADGKATFGFDYEHQSIKTATNGLPAPRSGSGSKFEWVWNDGLYITDVTWTPAATKAILDDEYKYVSPILFFNPDTGDVLDVFNAALVHTPALQELAGLQVSAADLSARLIQPSAGTAQNQTTFKDQNMTLLQQLVAKLGLPADTTDAAALSAVTTLHEKVNAVGTALKLDAKADVSAINAALSAATTGQAVAAALGAALQLPTDVTSDPAKATAAAVELAAKATGSGSADASSQAIASLSAQVAQLTAANTDRQLSELVDGAKRVGKLTPAMESWAKGLGVAGLSAYLQTAPVIAPTQATAQGQGAADPATSVAALGADASSIANQLGLKPTDLV